jgi:hypothetical protein
MQTHCRGVGDLKKALIFIVLIFLVGCSAFSSIQNFNVTAQSTPSIRIEPEQTLKLNVGESFTVNVTVENVEDICAVQVDIHYDPLVLNVTSVLEGPFLQSFGPTVVLFNESRVFLEAEPPYGQIYFVASLSGDPLPSASGSGVLFNITFNVISDGSSHLDFITYPGSGSEVGTYFGREDRTSPSPGGGVKLIDIVPVLYDGYYGSPITLRADPSEVKVGENVTLSGQILGVSEALDVIVYYREEGGSWSDIATVETNETGHFFYVWSATKGGVHQFKVSATMEGVDVESGVVSVHVLAPASDFMLYVYIAIIVVVVLVAVLIVWRRKKEGKPEEVP